MNYESITLFEDITINKLVSIHYFEYMSDFFFPGESHNFWEFLYVDRGEVDVRANDNYFTLEQGEVIFHKPNEFHGVKANGKIAPNLVVISFICDSSHMDFFDDQILYLNEKERSLLGQIVSEAKIIFSSPLDDYKLEKLERNQNVPFGGEQMIKISLEYFLIDLQRRYSNNDNKVSNSVKQLMRNKTNYDDETLNQIIQYMEDSVSSKLTIKQICDEHSIGRSQLQNLFKKNFDCGVIDFFSNMKIETAKQCIRESQMNFTQISEKLGFSSVHYFSKQFKKITDMTPTEYASSVKSYSEKTFL